MRNRPKKVTVVGQRNVLGQAISTPDVIVVGCDEEADRLAARMKVAGCQIGMMISGDSELWISDDGGTCVQVLSNYDFLDDIEAAFRSSGHYHVMLLPCLESDAVLLGWNAIDLVAAGVIANRYGTKIVAIVDNVAGQITKH